MLFRLQPHFENISIHGNQSHCCRQNRLACWSFIALWMVIVHAWVLEIKTSWLFSQVICHAIAMNFVSDQFRNSKWLKEILRLENIFEIDWKILKSQWTKNKLKSRFTLHWDGLLVCTVKKTILFKWKSKKIWSFENKICDRSSCFEIST